MSTTRTARSRSRRLVAAVALVASLGAGGVATAPAAFADSGQSSVRLPDGWGPEDIANGRDSTFYVGSIATGGIFKGDYETGQGSVLVPSAPSLTAGLFTELRPSGADRLWAAGGSSGDARVYDTRTGDLLATYHLAPPTAGAFVSDVIVTKSAVYYTDSFLPRLYVLPLGRNGALPDPAAVRTVDLSGDVAYTTVPFGFNLNGLAMVGDTLVSAQTNTGRLFAVDPDTGVTREIPVTDTEGRPFNLFGADGLVGRGNKLVIARNFPQRITTVKITSHARSAVVVADRTNPSLDIPSAVEEHDGDLWALNARFTTPLTPTTVYDVVRL